MSDFMRWGPECWCVVKPKTRPFLRTVNRCGIFHRFWYWIENMVHTAKGGVFEEFHSVLFHILCRDWKQPVTTSFSPADVNLGALDIPRLDLSYALSTVAVSLTVFDIGSKTWSTRPKMQLKKHNFGRDNPQKLHLWPCGPCFRSDIKNGERYCNSWQCVGRV